MEIQNASTTPSKSNQLQNVNTVRWESWNVTTQPWEINDRKSEVIDDIFSILLLFYMWVYDRMTNMYTSN